MQNEQLPLGDRLLRVFGFLDANGVSEPEEAAWSLAVPPLIFKKLNNNPGRNLRALAEIVIYFAEMVSEDVRLNFIQRKCSWTKLSTRCVELFQLRNMSHMTIVFHMSQSILSQLDRGTASPAMTRLMELAVVLAENLTHAQRMEFRANTWVFL